ncbi:hypothetical protein CN172_11395 [Sinorhizobium meliloti]|nr:hypothetical protein CN232_10680 [Sinorhizobium meliloti]RVH44185.1 hypothetical protein CN208_13535 [Sinorhizobium meliloti]RVK16640.1 hypothetical protein CN172_11395 [Sinorhizobium meliloti]
MRPAERVKIIEWVAALAAIVFVAALVARYCLDRSIFRWCRRSLVQADRRARPMLVWAQSA